MEHHTPTDTPNLPLAIFYQLAVIMSWIFTSLTMSDIAFFVSLIVSFMAVRYYYYATIKIKKDTK